MLAGFDLARLPNLVHLEVGAMHSAPEVPLQISDVATVDCPRVATLALDFAFSNEVERSYSAWLGSSLFPVDSDYLLHPTQTDPTRELESAKGTPGFPSLRQLEFSPHVGLDALVALVPRFGRCNRLDKRVRLGFNEMFDSDFVDPAEFLPKVWELCERERFELFFEF
ncbi:hypothetical protein JCM10212_006061 [Sporobolomyces blumeae]